MMSTISLTIEVGVKNSPPRWPSVIAKLPEEVLVDLPERVALDVVGIDAISRSSSASAVVDPGVGPRQDPARSGFSSSISSIASLSA